MTKQGRRFNNPYHAPSSTLLDESVWSLYAIKCAKKSQRVLFFGTLSSIYISMIATMVVDLLFFGAGIFSDRLGSAWIAVVLVTLGIIPGTSLYIRYKIRRIGVRKYISSSQENLKKWSYTPFFTTIVVLLFCVLCLLPVREEIRNLIFGLDLDLTALALKSRALLVLPFVMPITYMLAKASRRRAKYWLEKMAQSL